MAFKPLIRRVDFVEQVAWIDIVEVDDADTSIVIRTISEERLNLGSVLQNPLEPPNGWKAFAANLMAEKILERRNRRQAQIAKDQAEVSQLEAAEDEQGNPILA